MGKIVCDNFLTLVSWYVGFGYLRHFYRDKFWPKIFWLFWINYLYMNQVVVKFWLPVQPVSCFLNQFFSNWSSIPGIKKKIICQTNCFRIYFYWICRYMLPNQLFNENNWQFQWLISTCVTHVLCSPSSIMSQDYPSYRLTFGIVLLSPST